MGRMVGAAILIALLGGATVVAWWSSRGVGAGTPPSILLSPSSLDSTVTVRPARTPIVTLSDPLAFLSTAPADSLELLPGVGPVLATRLVAARDDMGAFRSWDDVDRVRGIGPKTIERLKNTAARR